MLDFESVMKNVSNQISAATQSVAQSAKGINAAYSPKQEETIAPDLSVNKTLNEIGLAVKREGGMSI